MKKKTILFTILLPIIVFLFLSMLSIGYSSWIISEPITITSTEIEIIDETFSDATYYEVTYDGNTHAPHIDLSESIPDTVFDYEVKYYKNGQSAGSGLYNGKSDFGEYVAEYYNPVTNLVTKLDFKINKADLNVTLNDQFSYYSLSTTPDTSKFVVKGVNNETVSGTWSLVTTSELVNEGGEKDSQYSSFYYNFTPSNENYNELKNVEVKLCYYSVAYLGSNGTKYYCNLKNALDSAASGSTKNVFVIPGLLENGTSGNLHPIDVSESITIKSGVTLTIPFTNEDWFTSSVNGFSNSFIDSNATNVNTYRKCLLELHEGADITIEAGGRMNLGGEFSASGICRYYSEINLDEGSSINVLGTFYCYGYIKENSTSAKNAYQTAYKDRYDNDYDSDRYLKLTNGGKIVTAFASYDLAGKGGGALSKLIENEICPVNIFEFPNIQTYFEIQAGGVLNAHTYMEVAGIALDEEVAVVGNNSSNAIFKLSEGSMSVHYCPANVLYSSATNSFTNISLDGILNQGYLKLSIKGIYDISTQNNYLPLSYKLKIYVGSGSTYTTNYKVKFLPGSSLFIEEGATVNVNNSVIFYKSDSLSSIDGISYPSKPDAICLNNGALVIGSNATIGGLIETTNTNGSAIIDFTSIGDNSLFSTSPEGVASVSNVTITSEGYFFNSSSNSSEVRQFVAGTTVTSSSNNVSCWEGPSYKQNKLEIKIDTSENYLYNVYDYVVHTYTDQNGNGKNELSQASSYNIQTGQYFSITTSRNKSASFLDSNVEFVSGQIYEMQSDMTLVIVPNKGIKIIYSSSSISGAGGSTYTFYEGQNTSSSSRVSLGTMPANGDFLIIEGYYLYFTFKGSMGSNLKTTKCEGGTITPALSAGSSVATGQNYKIDGINTTNSSYKIEFTLGYESSCITSDTLVTLANGTQVRIDQLTGHELLRVWDHVSGTFINVPIGYLIKHNDNETLHTVTKLSFSNDNFVKIIGDHTFYNASLNKYIIINENNAHLYVGDYFIYESNGKLEKVQLISADTYEEYTIAYSIETFGTITSFANGILSATPYLEAVLNAFDINSETFIYENMSEDINKYGVYSYDELSDLMTYEEYQMTNAKYFKVAIEKGIITWEEFMQAIEIFRSVEGDFIN